MKQLPIFFFGVNMGQKGIVNDLSQFYALILQPTDTHKKQNRQIWLLFLQYRMILEITGSTPKPIVKRFTWKQELKRSLYKKNQQYLCLRVSTNQYEQASIKKADEELADIFQMQEVNLSDSMVPTSCHSYYSSYIPLRMQNSFIDQLSLTFPFLRHMDETGRFNDRVLKLIDISTFMGNQKGNIDGAWQKCLTKYLCGIDSIKAAELYLEFKKFGTQKLAELHELYGGGCEKKVFFQRVMAAASSFRKQKQRGSSRLPFSIDIHDEINEISMPKTMKQLFCSICLSYDCNQHKFDDILIQKQYQYLAPGNLVGEDQNVRRAVTVCSGYMQLIEKGEVSGEPCSEGCYRRLGKKEWEAMQRSRAKLLSPLVKGVIKMGIDMFSYNPCAIWFLLAQQKIACSHVFLFLVQEYGLMGRLQRKLLESEEQALRRQKQMGEANLPEPPRRGRKRIRIANIEHCKAVTSCAHFFRGEPPVDPQCQNCVCRQRGFCLPQCLCGDDCPIRKRGCGCKKDECSSNKCVCFSNNSECDPLVCDNCFGEDSRKNCRNHGILSGEFKRVRVGRSTIPGAGLGLFAGEPVRRGELLMIYSGELIDQSIDVLRQCLSVDNSFYNFGSPQGAIDARFMGNASRFINHADTGKENLFSKNVLTEGRMKVAFYALRDIETDEEFFFDYDGEGKLYANFKEKYPFIKKKNLAVK